jgi:hypothetical protein
MKPYATTHPNTKIHSSHTYNPEFEAVRKASLLPRVRHQEMLEEHQKKKANARQDHLNRVHKMPKVLSLLI